MNHLKNLGKLNGTGSGVSWIRVTWNGKIFLWNALSLPLSSAFNGTHQTTHWPYTMKLQSISTYCFRNIRLLNILRPSVLMEA